MPDNKKLSAQPVISTVPARTRIPLLLHPADEPDEEKRNPTAGLRAVASALASFGPGPNDRPDGWKGVRYYLKVDRDGDPDGGDCFEELDFTKCAYATVIHVERYRTDPANPFLYNAELVAEYDESSTLFVNRSGAFSTEPGSLVPVKFVPRAAAVLPALQTFRFRTQAEAVGNSGGQTLDQLDYSTVYTYARALVEFYREDPSDLFSAPHFQELIAVYDPAAPAGRQGWRTSGGAAANAGRIGLQFVKLSDPAATGALKYDPDQPFVAGQLCYYDAGDGRGALFYMARQEMVSPVPAPMPGLSTDYWKPAADPGVPGGNGGGGAGTVESYLTLSPAPALTLDFAASSAQLLKLGGALSITATASRRQGQQLRLHLANVTASAVALSWPAAWHWRGIVPTALAAGKQATLSLECAWGNAESDIIAGFAAQP